MLIARLLANKGLQVTVVEPKALITSNQSGEELACTDPRVYALSPTSTQLLQSAGLWSDGLAADICPYHSMQVWDGNGVERIQLHAEDAGFTQLGHIVQHNILMKALQANLDQQAIAVLPSKLASLAPKEGHIEVELASGKTIKASLVIGADGVQSPTRTLSKLSIHKLFADQTATVAAVDLASAHECIARQVFTSEGCIGILPVGLTESGRVVIIWSAPNSLAAKISNTNDDQFTSLLARALEIQPTQINKLWPRQQFPLPRYFARQWSTSSVVLVGDAAHSIHPLTGLGLNLGFEDVALLAELICQAGPHTNGTLISSRRLNRYQWQRMPRIYSMMAFAESINYCFLQQSLGFTVLRNRLLRLADRSESFKSLAVQIASGTLPNPLKRNTS